MSMKHVMHEILDIVVPERATFWRDNKWYVLGGGLMVLLAGGFYGYRSYMVQRNAEAFGALGHYVERYLKNDSDKKVGARLDDGALELEAQAFSGSAAAPYFSTYKAQDLLNQGKVAEAADVLKKAVANMSSASPLTALYKVKLALVQLDVDDQAVQNEGMALLKKIADDVKSPAWDAAVYYLGRYSWVKGDVEDAKKIWAPALALVEQARAEGSASRYSESPWLARAQTLLKNIA
jgi:predicted negative regulator of RcsB-dependent stress response